MVSQCHGKYSLRLIRRIWECVKKIARKSSLVFFLPMHTQAIHVWYIYLHLPSKDTPNVGKYTLYTYE